MLYAKLIGFACASIALIVVTTTIIIWQLHPGYDDKLSIKLPSFPDPSPSKLGVFGKAAVSCDVPICADIGKNVLKDGGNVVDAAIATLLCMGVVHGQSMGVGGGFLMVMYNKTVQYALSARGRAPAAAHKDMFQGNPAIALRGGLSVTVPGELKGYWEMYQKLGGKVPWSRLFQPAIDLCENGYLVSRYTSQALREQSRRIKNTPSLAEIFIDKSNGQVFKQNDTIRRPVLAKTFRLIAQNERNGGNLLYLNTTLMRNFVDDLKQFGGIIEYEDMLNYTTSWTHPLVTNLSNGIIHFSVPPPGSGLILSYILKLMDGFSLCPKDLQDFNHSATTVQRLLEATKHAYAKRTLLGDPDPLFNHPDQVAEVEELVRNLTSVEYIDSIRNLINDDSTNDTLEYYGAKFHQPQDHGTSQLCIIDENGAAIAITSTINQHFGAAIRSTRTGIIYNDEMDDFSSPKITSSFKVPPSPNNFILPGKRSVSSMSPSIFVDSSKQVRLVIGATGATQITTSIASVTMRNLWLGQTIKQAIDAPRLHHQLLPMEIVYEDGFPKEFIDKFASMGHKVTHFAQSGSAGTSIVVGITRNDNGTMYANTDYRRGGSIAGYD